MCRKGARTNSFHQADQDGHPVQSPSKIFDFDAQAMGPMSFTTIILSGPLGQLTWTAETWRESLQNHETAVSKLIRSMTSECGV